MTAEFVTGQAYKKTGRLNRAVPPNSVKLNPLLRQGTPASGAAGDQAKNGNQDTRANEGDNDRPN